MHKMMSVYEYITEERFKIVHLKSHLNFAINDISS
jgi:hypothetical protein